VSVALWTFFEALNLRLGNWYYVMDHPLRAVRWAGGVVAFATVLPADLGELHLPARALERRVRAWLQGLTGLGVAHR
jgi:hypothetical protein